jgi:hypothetical protein
MTKERMPYNVALFGTNEPDEKERVLRSIRRNPKGRDAGYLRPVALIRQTELSASIKGSNKVRPMECLMRRLSSRTICAKSCSGLRTNDAAMTELRRRRHIVC